MLSPEWRTLSIALALSWVAMNAHAQSKTPAEIFEEGKVAHDAGNYALALERYRQAYEQEPHDSARLAIALCLEGLARYSDALTELEAIAESEALSVDERVKAAERMGALREIVGRLIVSGRPEGAEVLVDGKARCRIPCTLVIDPQDHEVIVTNGGRKQRFVIDVSRGGKTELEVDLVDPPPPPPPPPRQPTPPPPPEGRAFPSWFGWSGVALSSLGVAGIIGFGVRTGDLHDEYLERPTVETRDEGELTRTMTNVCIGVAGMGALIFGVDLVLHLTSNETDTGWSDGGLTVRF